MGEKTFKVYGYDKDSGIYEAVCGAESEEKAAALAYVLAVGQDATDRLKSSAGDPFDWFVIDNGDGYITTAFTKDEPDGLPVEP